jgi:ankyrin repeat protein
MLVRFSGLLMLLLAATAWAAKSGDLRLLEAVKSGDRNAALALLADNTDVNAPEPDGTTPLHWAVHQNDLDLVQRLLHAGAQVNVKNDYGVTPFTEAAVRSNTAILESLLKAGANVNATNEDGQSALMIVARTGNVGAAQLLLSHGAKINAAESWRGQTALMWAAAEDQPAMVKELASHGADLNARSKVNDWDRQVTAEHRAKYMPVGGWTALLFAARQGHLDCAKALVEAGADKDLQDPDGVSPMVMAIVNGHYNVAAYLAQQGADVNLADRWGRTGLWAAVDMHTLPHSGRPDPIESESVNSTDLLKVLLAHDADVNVQLVTFPPYRSMSDRGGDGILGIGATPLLRAAKAGDTVGMRMLLAKGADPNLASNAGMTPLLAAAGVGSRSNDTRGRYRTEAEAIESIRLLLASGANINAEDARGQTALHGAAFSGWNQLVQYLADHGAKLDAKDKRGMTPIDSAMGRAGGNGFGGHKIEVHQDTAALLQKLIASAGTSQGEHN